MSVYCLDRLRVSAHRWRVRGRAVPFGALALTLSAVLLLAACGGETAARVATPAQAPEEEPEHTHGLGDDDGHTHEDGTAHTHDDESAEEDEVGPGVPGDADSTATVPVVDEGDRESDFWGSSRLPGYEDMEEGKVYIVGPEGYVEVEEHPRKTDTHQHSAPGDTIEHEHSYLTGTEGLAHSHDNGELVYQHRSLRFTDDDILTTDEYGNPNYMVGKVECTPTNCGRITAVGPKLELSKMLDHVDGSRWYCPKLDGTYETLEVVATDLEGQGCVLQAE